MLPESPIDEEMEEVPAQITPVIHNNFVDDAAQMRMIQEHQMRHLQMNSSLRQMNNPIQPLQMGAASKTSSSSEVILPLPGVQVTNWNVGEKR